MLQRNGYGGAAFPGGGGGQRGYGKPTRFWATTGADDMGWFFWGLDGA